MNSHAIGAIFRRNFLSYFNSLTGYVFICLFVMLSSFAAFWTFDFFNNNLDNLDQLSRYLPYILLFFIPAITMSIWADERRQGTDELLLTLPASDVDVVAGKFLAGVGIYSVALMFSLICTLLMLRFLGHPDVFLFAANYFGFWLMGTAMIAVGMVGSFLTGNLTVAFILGVVFNAPLVFADLADAFTGSPEWTQTIKHWGIPEQFRDFGRGMIGLSSTLYFCLLAVVMLYLCLVLIGRRHWMGGRDGQSLLGHYLVRFLCLLVAAVGLDMVVETFNLRYDVTAERVSSLSPDTVSLLRGLDTKNRPIHIDAYVSPLVPENYVQTRLNLLNDLREFEKLGGGRVQVRIVNTEPTTEEATNAEQQFGIKPHAVRGNSRGTMKDEQIFMGAAITCGLQKVVVPFFDRGTPIEYELIRSIATVAQAKRKKLGVVTTDVQLFGGFDMQRMQPLPRQQIIDELEKQYDVVQVDPSKPIEKFDALLAVQPSSLAQPQLFNLIQAIRNGQPTAIFEDPAPVFQAVAGTTEPKQGMQGMPGPAKGDIGELWSLLGIKYVAKERGGAFAGTTSSDSVVWQDWNPYPKLFGIARGLPREFVFIGRHEPGGKTPFNDESPITSGLQEMWFPFPGAVEKLNTSTMKFVELIGTGNTTGTIPSDQIRSVIEDAQSRIQLEDENTTHESYCVAAHITGEVKGRPAPDTEKKDAGKKADSAKPKSAVEEAEKKRAAEASHTVNVVLVPDIDLMANEVFRIHSDAEEEEIGAHFDNIVFVLNTLDVLAGDTKFVEIRKREPSHRTLETIEGLVADYRQERDEAHHEAQDKVNAEISKAQAGGEEFEQKLRDFQKKAQELQRNGEDITPELREEITVAALNQKVESQRIANRVEQLKRGLARQDEILDRQSNSKTIRVENIYKFAILVLPPILPFIVGMFVFFSRRAQEREGVAKSRLR
ncbi:MAG TPA: Gldg family protein [Pirellulales bacterium]|jgi:ABC-2 type transport system permease protein|nr:Gldg family protein [Pirellulales bacterium]